MYSEIDLVVLQTFLHIANCGEEITMIVLHNCVTCHSLCHSRAIIPRHNKPEHLIASECNTSITLRPVASHLLRYPRLYIYPISTSILTLISSYFYLHSQHIVTKQ